MGCLSVSPSGSLEELTHEPASQFARTITTRARGRADARDMSRRLNE